MNINFEISDLKKRTEGDEEEKIMQLVDVWDGCINDIMRELVRIYDSIVVTPQDGRGFTSYKMEKRLDPPGRPRLHILQNGKEAGEMLPASGEGNV